MKKEKELKIYDSVLMALKIKKLHMIICVLVAFRFTQTLILKITKIY